MKICQADVESDSSISDKKKTNKQKTFFDVSNYSVEMTQSIFLTRLSHSQETPSKIVTIKNLVLEVIKQNNFLFNM